MRSHLPDLFICLPGLLLAGVGAGCAGSSPENSPPPAETGLVTGTVAYRERMALPPDAEVRVQLSDVSLQDVPAQVLAETTLSPSGRQVPLPFVVIVYGIVQQYGVDGLLAATLMAGFILLALGLAKLGGAIKFISASSNRPNPARLILVRASEVGVRADD